MISADSILSMFTDRFTLLKYLQVLDEDVQKLLEKAVTSISVDKVPDSDDEYTLTINFEDGTSETTPAFVIAQGEDGRGISSIAKTGTSGNVDTYTITYTDDTTSTFTVTNGTPLYKHNVIFSDYSGVGTIDFTFNYLSNRSTALTDDNSVIAEAEHIFGSLGHFIETGPTNADKIYYVKISTDYIEFYETNVPFSGAASPTKSILFANATIIDVVKAI